MDELGAGTERLLARIEEVKNCFQPVQRLPPDMIVEVATYLNPRLCHGACQPLMAMSQVCRYWRETLLSNPSESWSFIRSEFLELVPLFLARSGSYPLEVNLTNTWTSYTVGHVRPHANRLTILRCHVEVANTTFLRTLSRLDHSPNLHTLSLASARIPSVAPEKIKMRLIFGDMPALRTLELLPFPIIPQFLQFKHLVDLRLEVTHSILTGVLDLLAANHSLEKLRLMGSFWYHGDTHGAERIVLGCLRFLTVERCAPRRLLEKLTLPRGTRVFIRYKPSRSVPPAFTTQESVERYANLQGLTSLHVLVLMNDTYVDATGPNGSLAVRFKELQDPSAMRNAIAPLPTAGITRLVCELHPASKVAHTDKITRMMDILPHLEEIKLIHFGEEATRAFLSVLRTTSRWTKLRRLEFVHCRRVTDWILNLIRVALERKGEGLMLETVTIVYKREPLSGMFERLERTVEALELVEEGAAEMVRSELVWDDISCTTRVTSVPVGWD